MLELHVEMICVTLLTNWKGSSVPVDVFLLPSVVGLMTGAGNSVTIQSTQGRIQGRGAKGLKPPPPPPPKLMRCITHILTKILASVNH